LAGNGSKVDKGTACRVHPWDDTIGLLRNHTLGTKGTRGLCAWTLAPSSVLTGHRTEFFILGDCGKPFEPKTGRVQTGDKFIGIEERRSIWTDAAIPVDSGEKEGKRHDRKHEHCFQGGVNHRFAYVCELVVRCFWSARPYIQQTITETRRFMFVWNGIRDVIFAAIL
jgi:hypothetical protein